MQKSFYISLKYFLPHVFCLPRVSRAALFYFVLLRRCHMEAFLFSYPSRLCLLITHNTTHSAEGQKVAENKSGFCELQIVAAFEIVSGGWCRVLTFRAWVTWAPGLSCPLHTVDIRQSSSCLLKTLFLNWSDIFLLHDSRALIPLWVCDRPINFNQRLPLPFWQLTQATKLTPITSNFMAIKCSSIFDKYKWTFVSRIVFQNIFAERQFIKWRGGSTDSLSAFRQEFYNFGNNFDRVSKLPVIHFFSGLKSKYPEMVHFHWHMRGIKTMVKLWHVISL